MLPGLHNIPAHFGVFFWLGAFGNACFIPYLYIYYLKTTLPSHPAPVPSLIWMQMGRQEKLWSLGGFMPMWGHRKGVSLPWGSLSPELFVGSGPCRPTHSKGKHFFFSCAKKAVIHWTPMPAFCLNQWCVCGVDFSFKNRAKVYLVCFDFFSSPSPVWWKNWRTCWNMTLKVRQAFSWHGKGLWCSCQNVAQVKGCGTPS